MFPRKHIFSVPICVSSLAAVTVLGNSVCATAQTSQPEVPMISNNRPNTEAANTEATTTVYKVRQFANAATEKTPNHRIIPVPGTVGTSSTMLTTQDTKPTSQSSGEQIAQGDIDLGKPTHGSSSYVGVGGNIGLGGSDSPLADGNFVVISKVRFSKSLSVRPSAILADDVVFLIPLTYDFSFQQLGDPYSEPLPIAPYVGVGAAVRTGERSKTAVMVTGGVDIPLNNRFTATAAVNAGFFDQTDFGLLVGVGYNFSGF